jgi:hypothetical protein
MLVTFQLAYDEWVRQRIDGQEALLKELGIDRSAFGRGRVADLYALARDVMKDPKKKARMEAFYEAHQAEHEGAEARLLQMEDEAAELLECDDTESLLLSVVALCLDIPPAENRFLKVHCYASMRDIFKTAAEGHARARESSGSRDA